MSDQHVAFLMQHEPWKERANCIGADPRIFIPDQGVTTADAKIYCMSCEVRKECADYGRRTKSIGVFGGKLFTFRFSEPVELMPLRIINDGRPKPARPKVTSNSPSILGKVAAFSRPSILGR